MGKPDKNISHIKQTGLNHQKTFKHCGNKCQTGIPRQQQAALLSVDYIQKGTYGKLCYFKTPSAEKETLLPVKPGADSA